MKNIALHEFQYITGLSDSALLNLLKSNSLICNIEKEIGIAVNIESVDLQSLINARITKKIEALSLHKESIKERLALVIRSKLDELLEEATSNLLPSK